MIESRFFKDQIFGFMSKLYLISDYNLREVCRQELCDHLQLIMIMESMPFFIIPENYYRLIQKYNKLFN